MSLTEAEYIALIITEMGGDTDDATLATNLPTYWEEIRSGVADLNVRYLYVKLDAIDLLLGAAARSVTFRTSSGSSVNLSDLFDHFKALREVTASALAASVPGAGAAVGLLTQTAPIMRDNARQQDPNSRSLRGDPLRRPH